MVRKSVNIGHLSTFYHTNFILMSSVDHKRSMGIPVNWKLFGTGPEMVRAFEKGELDIGYMGLPPAAIGIDRGVRIKCVASGHVEGTILIATMNFDAIDHFNDNITKTLTQFKEKTIGVTSKGSIHDVILRHYLNEANLMDDVEVKNYDQAEFIALAMRDGIVQGGVGTPALSVFAQTLLDTKIIIHPRLLWPNNPSYGIFFNENVMSQEPELVIKFLKCHKTASDYIREKPSSAARIIANHIKVADEDYIEKVLEISPKYSIDLSDGFIKATMDFIEVLKNLGYVKNQLTIPDIFNFEFLEQL